MRAALLCAILNTLCFAAPREAFVWTHASTPHFEIYSNSDPASARALAIAFEQLRTFFIRQVDLSPRPQREVRVICFATEQEYQLYRLRAGTSAYFIGAEGRDYIVMPALPRGDLRSAAHEYAHALIHSGAWTLPDWLAEGIGDVISTLQIRDRETRIGGDLPGRSQMLRTAAWMPLRDLFAFSLKAPAATGRAEGSPRQSPGRIRPLPPGRTELVPVPRRRTTTCSSSITRRVVPLITVCLSLDL